MRALDSTRCATSAAPLMANSIDVIPEPVTGTGSRVPSGAACKSSGRVVWCVLPLRWFRASLGTAAAASGEFGNGAGCRGSSSLRTRHSIQRLSASRISALQISNASRARIPSSKKRKQQKRPIPETEPRINESALAPFLESVLDPKFQLLPWDSSQEYAHLRFRLIDQLKPQGTVEQLLVEQILSGTWRLNRSYAIEKGILISPNLVIAQERADWHDAELYLAYDLTDQRSLGTEKEPEGPEQRTPEGRKKFVYRTSTIDQGLAFIRSAEGDPLARLQHYQKSLEESIYRALHELQRLQAARSIPALDLGFLDVDDELKRRRIRKSAGQSHARRKGPAHGYSLSSGKPSKTQRLVDRAAPGRPPVPDAAIHSKGKECLQSPRTNPDVPGTATGRQA